MPTGSCVCGDLTYSFSGEPLMKALCHCLTCRKLTGSAYATAFLVPDPDDADTATTGTDSPAATTTPGAAKKPDADFKCVSKTNTAPRTTKGTHETGLDMTFTSCAQCPSTLFKKAKEGFPGVVIVFAGCLDAEGRAEDGEGDAKTGTRGKGGMEALGTPQAELWVKYRLPWIREVEGAKQCQEFQ